MTKEDIRKLIKDLIHEYMGTGSSGGNAGDGNSIPSYRPFSTNEKELAFYNDKGAPFGGAEGQQTTGMERPQPIGNPNRTKFTKF